MSDECRRGGDGHQRNPQSSERGDEREDLLRGDGDRIAAAVDPDIHEPGFAEEVRDARGCKAPVVIGHEMPPCCEGDRHQ